MFTNQTNGSSAFISLFETMQDGFAYCHMLYDADGKPDDFIYMHVNRAFERITRLKNVSGKKRSEIVPTDKESAPEIFEAYIRVCSTGKPERFEIFIPPLKLWLSISVSSPQKDDFIALFNDITEHKQTAVELYETRNYLENLLNYANAPIIVWDSEFRITRFNKAFERLVGRSAEEMLGERVDTLFPERTKDQSFEHIKIASSGEHWEIVEIEIQNASGEVRTLLWNSATVYSQDGSIALATIAQGQDITERKAVEASLKQSEARYRSIFEESSISLWEEDLSELKVYFDNLKLIGVDDLREYFKNHPEAITACSQLIKIIDVNKETLRIFDSDDKNIVKTAMFESLVYSADPVFKEKLVSIFERKPYFQNETAITTPDGSIRYFIIRHSIVPGYEETLSRVYLSLLDITDQKRADEEKKVFQAKLVQADKMASLGLLASGVAHEINNPNNYILFNSEILAKAWQSAMPILENYYSEHGEYKLGSMQYSETRDIIPRLFSGLIDGSERIRTIVEKLKNLARDDADRSFEPVDINCVVIDTIHLLNHEIKRYCDNFELVTGSDLPPAWCNAQQIEQVLINLMINSLQALPDKKCSLHIKTSLSEDNKRISIVVEDKGTGIAPEIMQRLTEPFFTTKGSQGGTGLGLYISRMIMQDNRGELLITSTPGKGTEATVLLPCYFETDTP